MIKNTKKPNVILLLVDDQGYGDLSCHGNPALKTPNLDRLHAESVRFTDFHVMPMCTPTRGQLLTGRDAAHNGASCVALGRTVILPEVPTIAEVFAANGYRTGMFGKWHLGENYPHRPMERGFQEAVYHHGGAIGTAGDYWNNDYFDDTYRHNGALRRYEGYCTDVWFTEAISWMTQRTQLDEPFFLYLPTNADHVPLFVPDHYREPYRSLGNKLASFFGMTACIDENVGRLDQALADLGIRDETIFIYTTDNGGTAGVDFYNAGMRGRKSQYYEGGHRVPCFVRWPGGPVQSGRDVTCLTDSRDIMPTLIDLCGLKAGAEVQTDGRSLTGLLGDPASDVGDRMLVVQMEAPQQPGFVKWQSAVMWNTWRLVHGDELYDVATDPAQERNVFEQNPEIASRMRGFYERWWDNAQSAMGGQIPISIHAREPTTLVCVDWMIHAAHWTYDGFYQRGIRTGHTWNGSWRIRVETAGDYEFSLRRWPQEVDAPLAGSVEAFIPQDATFEPGNMSDDEIRSGHGCAYFPQGVRLPIAYARLVVSDRVCAFAKTVEVPADATAVRFRVRLEAGETNVRTWFLDEAKREICGAYYVDVEKL